MLTLSRKERERIIIDDHIIIEVVTIGRGRVQLGVIAPLQVKVYREELYMEKLERERATATRSAEGNGQPPAQTAQRPKSDPPGV